MSAMSRKSGDRPVIAWIGAPPPRSSREEVSAFSVLTHGWHPEASLITIWVAEGPGAVRALPPEAAGVPVIAASEHPPSPEERRAWLLAGAEDLVSLDALPAAVAARLKRLQRERDQLRATPPAPPFGAPAAESAVTARPPDLARDRRSRDDFPALLVPRPPEGVPGEVRAWIEQVRPYLELRESLLGGWNNGVLERYLELLHRRALIAPRSDDDALPDTLGEVHGTQTLPVTWPCLIRRGPARGRTGIEVAEARIVGAGTDGLTLDVNFAASPRQKLVMDLAVDAEANAQFLLQARWQRRTGTDRWLLGALILEMRLREVPVVTA